MKIRLAIALVGLAIGSVLPTFAQQKDMVDPQIAQRGIQQERRRRRRRVYNRGRGLEDAARNIYRAAGHRK